MAGLLRAHASSKYLPSPLSAPATKATLMIALTQTKLRYTFQNAGQLFTLFTQSQITLEALMEVITQLTANIQ